MKKVGRNVIRKKTEKHEKFSKAYKEKLIIEGDIRSEADRLRDYLEVVKKSRVKNKEGLIKDLMKSINDAEADAAYTSFLEENDYRKKIEKEFPKFTKKLIDRFELLMRKWKNNSKVKITNNNELMILNDICANCYFRIENDWEIRYLIIESEKTVEKNLPPIEPGMIRLLSDGTDLIESQLGLPELVLNTISNTKDGANEAHGNWLKHRKDKTRLNKYKNISKLMKVAEVHFPKIYFKQKNACILQDVNEKAFSKWKNTPANNLMFHEWQKNITDDEIGVLMDQMNNYSKSR